MPSVRPVTLGALSFDSVGADGLSWVVTGVDGWDDGSASTLATLQKLRGPGGYRSSDPQLTQRALSLTGAMFGPTTATVVRGCSALKSAATLTETTLTSDDPGFGVRTMRVSRQGAVLLKDEGELCNTWSVSLIAADPRKFGPVLTASTALPYSTGGLTVPFTVPFSINATTVAGSVSMTNQGDIAGPVLLRIAGPVVAPIVTHRGPDGVATVFALSLTLAAGEFVDVDMSPDALTVLAQGQSSRAQFITARGWQSFPPGTSTWFFAGGDPRPPSVTRTNLCTNPSVETVTTDWSAGGNATVAVDATTAYVGSRSMKLTATAAGQATAGAGKATVNANQTYTFSTYVKATSGRATFSAVDWITSGGAYISTSSGADVTATGTGWVRVSMTITAPATAASGNLYVGVRAMAAGEVAWADATLAEGGSTLGDYFDGNSAAAGQVYAWTGAANASTSTSTTSPVPPPALTVTASSTWE